jgi:hypothetical protein
VPPPAEQAAANTRMDTTPRRRGKACMCSSRCAAVRARPARRRAA